MHPKLDVVAVVLHVAEADGELVRGGLALHGERAIGDGSLQRARLVQNRREVARVVGRIAEQVQLLVELAIARESDDERDAGEQGLADGNKRD